LSRIIGNRKIENLRYKIQIIGPVKGGKSLKSNELINFKLHIKKVKRKINKYGLFPINADPMTVQRLIFTTDPTLDKD
jgi:hypothetical protein